MRGSRRAPGPPAPAPVPVPVPPPAPAPAGATGRARRRGSARRRGRAHRHVGARGRAGGAVLVDCDHRQACRLPTGVGVGDRGVRGAGHHVVESAVALPVDAVLERAAASVGDGSSAPTFTVAGTPATIAASSHGGHRGDVADRLAAVGWRQSCPRSPDVKVTGPAGPSPSPTATSAAAGSVGDAPVASSNSPSPSTSQSNVAAGRPPCRCRRGSGRRPRRRVGPARVGHDDGRLDGDGRVAAALAPPSLSVAVTLSVNVPAAA